MRRRRILKTRFFNRWALRAGLADGALRTAVQEIEQGLIDGDLLALNERQIDAQTQNGALEEIIG
jgi:hypothetical protein